MKISILISLLISTYVFSQSPSIQWEKSFGGSQEDYGYTVIIDSDENIIAGGSTLSSDGDITQSYGGLDIWIIKYDPNGNLIWKNNYGGSGEDYIWDILATDDGGYIFAGNTTSTDGDVSENFGASDFWVVKLDSEGNIEWEKSYGGSHYDDLSRIIKNGDLGFILIGSSWSDDGDFQNNSGDSDVALAKIDNNGNLIWTKLYGGPEHDFGIGGIIDNSNQVIINSFGESETNGSDVRIDALTQEGDFIWTQTFSGSGSDQTYSFIQLENGNYLIGMNSNSNDGDFENNFGGSDIWLFEFQVGLIHHKFHFGGSSSEAPMALYQTSSGEVIVANRSASSDGDVSNNHGSSDFWVFKMTSDGNIIWENSYGGTEADDLWDMAVTNNTIALIGNTNSNNGDISAHQGLNDMWIVKLNGSDMGQHEFTTSSVNIYPNPASEKLIIESKEPVLSIELFDLSGKQIKGIQRNNNLTELNLSGISNGTYILKIKTIDGNLINKKIIKSK